MTYNNLLFVILHTVGYRVWLRSRRCEFKTKRATKQLHNPHKLLLSLRWQFMLAHKFHS